MRSWEFKGLRANDNLRLRQELPHTCVQMGTFLMMSLA